MIVANPDAKIARIERAAARNNAARRSLEDAMRAARAAGLPLRPIADAAGMSHEWARQITNKEAS
jgi:hypothetical protein